MSTGCNNCPDPDTCAERKACQYRQRAERLWPDSPVNQVKWLGAVKQVRGTSRGWLLDNPKERTHA